MGNFLEQRAPAKQPLDPAGEIGTKRFEKIHPPSNSDRFQLTPLHFHKHQRWKALWFPNRVNPSFLATHVAKNVC